VETPGGAATRQGAAATPIAAGFEAVGDSAVWRGEGKGKSGCFTRFRRQ
jgi:hypothetical protein